MTNKEEQATATATATATAKAKADSRRGGQGNMFGDDKRKIRGFFAALRMTSLITP